MTKGEVHKWMNLKTDENEKIMKESLSNYTLNPDLIRLMARQKALEDFVADLIEKHF